MNQYNFLCTSSWYNPKEGRYVFSGVLEHLVEFEKNNHKSCFFPSAVLDCEDCDVAVGDELLVTETKYRDYANRIVCHIA